MAHVSSGFSAFRMCTAGCSLAIAGALMLGAGPARAGIIVNAVGIGQATGDVWGHLANRRSAPPAPPTHTLTVAGYLPNVFLGPGLSLCDPRTFVAITSISSTPYTYRYNQDGRAFGGDSIGADGSDLAQYAHAVSTGCEASIEVTQEVTPTSIHIYGTMISSDSGAVARMRLIDGSDPLEPIIIYEDLFLNPNSSQMTRPIDLTIPMPSGGPQVLFMSLDIYGSSLPTPGSASLMGIGGLLIARRRR